MARRYRRRNRNDDLFRLVALICLFGAGWWIRNVGSIQTLMFLVIGVAVLIVGFRFWFRWAERARLERSGINEVDRMSGEQFEQFLQAYFRRIGCRVRLTPAQADYGADLLVEQDGSLVVVQAKRWNRTVGVDAVQEAVAAIGYHKGDRAMVITNNRFTANARKLAEANGVELWDRDVLTQRLLHAPGTDAGECVSATGSTDDNVCPSCGKQLLDRLGKRGPFIGCTGFPVCRYTRDV